MESEYVADYSDLPVIKNLPGLIIVKHKQDSNDDEQSIIGWNRCMAYCSLSSTPTSVYNFYQRLPTFSFTAKTRPQRKKKYRHHVESLCHLFSVKKDEDTIKYTVGQYSVQTCINDKQCCIITKDRRDDIYHPIAILQENKLIGGLQINVGLYMAKITDASIISVHKQPIRSIITGMCMHGSNIKLIDNFGQEYPMTIKSDALAKDQIIVQAIEKRQQLYPHEKLTYKVIESMIPLFYILGNGVMPTLYFHLPTAEYIVHALELVLTGHMTISAFHQNVNYVIKRTKIHHRWLTNFCSQNNMQLVTETPMQKLILQDDGSFSLQSFLDRIQVSIDLLNTKQENLNLSAHVAQRCWTWLSQSHTEPFRSIWKFILDKDKSFIQDNLLDMSSLQSLKYFSYTIQITATKLTSDSNRILMVAPYRERQISLSYKHLFADKYGAILGLHWMMPILSNISHNNELYHLEDYLDPLDELIENDIISRCFLETGAAAMNTDNEYTYSYSKAKAEILSEHRKAIEQQMHSSAMIIDH